MVNDTTATSPMQTSYSTPDSQPASDTQKAFAAALESNLPEALKQMADNRNNNDPVFLKAISQVKLVSVTFNGDQADISFSLPDLQPSACISSGITQYVPYSGAQAYIRDSYAKLCDMGKVTNLALLKATLTPRKDVDGSLTIDWKLYQLSPPCFPSTCRSLSLTLRNI